MCRAPQAIYLMRILYEHILGNLIWGSRPAKPRRSELPITYTLVNGVVVWSLSFDFVVLRSEICER